MDTMVHKLTTNQGYKTIKDSSDPIGLLKLIKKICYSYQTEQFQVLAMIRAVKQVFNITQGHKETNIDYLDRFKNRMTVAMSCGAEFMFPGVLDFISVETYHRKYNTLTDQVEITNVRTLTQEVVKATLYLDSASKGRYGNLMRDLENDYLKDRDNFPQHRRDTEPAPQLQGGRGPQSEQGTVQQRRCLLCPANVHETQANGGWKDAC
jgi:hypothetical protein